MAFLNLSLNLDLGHFHHAWVCLLKSRRRQVPQKGHEDYSGPGSAAIPNLDPPSSQAECSG